MTTERLTPTEALARLHTYAQTLGNTRAPENHDLIDQAAERAANKADEAWAEGQAADRQHDRNMRRGWAS